MIQVVTYLSIRHKTPNDFHKRFPHIHSKSEDISHLTDSQSVGYQSFYGFFRSSFHNVQYDVTVTIIQN